MTGTNWNKFANSHPFPVTFGGVSHQPPSQTVTMSFVRNTPEERRILSITMREKELRDVLAYLTIALDNLAKQTEE